MYFKMSSQKCAVGGRMNVYDVVLADAPAPITYITWSWAIGLVEKELRARFGADRVLAVRRLSPAGP
jgi:hypothetical protein